MPERSHGLLRYFLVLLGFKPQKNHSDRHSFFAALRIEPLEVRRYLTMAMPANMATEWVGSQNPGVSDSAQSSLQSVSRPVQSSESVSIQSSPVTPTANDDDSIVTQDELLDKPSPLEANSTHENVGATVAETLLMDDGVNVEFSSIGPNRLSSNQLGDSEIDSRVSRDIVAGEVNHFGYATSGAIQVAADILSPRAIKGQLHGAPGWQDWVSIDGHRMLVRPGVTIISLHGESDPTSAFYAYTFERPGSLSEAASIIRRPGSWLVLIVDDGGTNSWSTGAILGVEPVQQWTAALGGLGASFPLGFRVPVAVVVSDGTATYQKWGAAEGAVDLDINLVPSVVDRAVESAPTFLEIHSEGGPWGSMTARIGYSNGRQEVLVAKMGGEGARYRDMNEMNRGDHLIAIGLLDKNEFVPYAAKSVDTYAANSRVEIDAYVAGIKAGPNGIVIRGISDSGPRDEGRIPKLQIAIGSESIARQGVYEGTVDATVTFSNSWLARQKTLSGVVDLLRANEDLSSVFSDVVERANVRRQIQFSFDPPSKILFDEIEQKVSLASHNPQTLLAALYTAAADEAVRNSSHPTFAAIAQVLTELHPELTSVAEVTASPDFMLILARELWVRAVDHTQVTNSFSFPQFLKRLGERVAESDTSSHTSVSNRPESNTPSNSVSEPMVGFVTDTSGLTDPNLLGPGKEHLVDVVVVDQVFGNQVDFILAGDTSASGEQEFQDDLFSGDISVSAEVSTTTNGTDEVTLNSAPTSSISGDGSSSSKSDSAISTTTGDVTGIAGSTGDEELFVPLEIVVDQLNRVGFKNISSGPTGVSGRLEGWIPGLTIEFDQVQLRQQLDGSLRLIGKASVNFGSTKLEVDLRSDLDSGIVLRDGGPELVRGKITFVNPSAKSGLTKLVFGRDTSKNEWTLGVGFKVADKVVPLDFQWKNGVAEFKSGIENASILIAPGVFLDDLKFGISSKDGVTGVGGRISHRLAPFAPKFAEGIVSWTGGPNVQDALDVKIKFLNGKIGEIEGKLTVEDGSAVIRGKGSLLFRTVEVVEAETIVNLHGVRMSGTGTASVGGSIFAKGQVSAALSADGNDENDTIVVAGALRNGETRVHTFKAGRWEQQVVDNLADAAMLVVSPFGTQAATKTAEFLNWGFDAMQAALNSKPTPPPPMASTPPDTTDLQIDLPAGDEQATTPSGNPGAGQGSGDQSNAGGNSGGSSASGGSSSGGVSTGSPVGSVNVGTAIQSGAASLMTSALSNLIANSIRENLNGLPGQVAAQVAADATRRMVEPLVKDVLSQIFPAIRGTIPTPTPIIQPGSFAGGVISLLPVMLGALGAPKPVQDVATVVSVALYNPALLPLLPFVGWYQYSLTHNAKKAANSLRDALEKWHAVQVGVYSFAVRHLDTTDPEAVKLLSSLANLPGHPQDQESVITSVKGRLGVLLGTQVLEGRASLPDPTELNFRGWEPENRDAVRDNFVVDLASAAYDKVYAVYGGASRIAEFFGHSQRSFEGMRLLKALHESSGTWRI